jgi:steroid delta-isomerase-like uncharacterized protein
MVRRTASAGPAPGSDLLEGLPDELREFGKRWLAAWSARSPDRIAELCTEDVIWEDPALEAPRNGREAVRQLLHETFRAFPDLTFGLTEPPFVAPDGASAAVAWRVTGTSLGPLDPPGLAPTGRPFTLEGVDLYDIRDGCIARMRTRYDVLESLRQMGVAPARGSAAERLLLGMQRTAARFFRKNAE